MDAEVYLHVRGWSRAFVTHLDIEALEMNSIVARPKQGFYAKASYQGGALRIYAAKALKPCILVIREGTLLPRVFSDRDETWVFVGGKFGGIFIGFRKEFVRRMEELAKELWGIEPKGR